MQTHDSVSDMVSSYAEQAVQTARASNAQLDYSENSLMEVETILAQLARKMADGTAQSEDVGEVCKMWGSYLGEVVRRRFGGEWSIETYPGKQFATLTLSVGANKLFPTMKIHRRLTQGEEDSVWSFYKMVKTRLEAKPGARIQRPQ
jgi:hypothetical protein